jgi:hypothetical protein
MKETLKKVFRCYGPETTARDILVDQVHIITLGIFLAIVGLDWKYWKTCPYGFHTMICYGIVFTFLFLRMASEQTDIKDLKGILRSLHSLPQAVCALLSSINALALTFALHCASVNYPNGLLRLPYKIMALLVVILGYAQFAYFIYFSFRIASGKNKYAFSHHEMQEEEVPQPID